MANKPGSKPRAKSQAPSLVEGARRAAEWARDLRQRSDQLDRDADAAHMAAEALHKKIEELERERDAQAARDPRRRSG